MTKPMYTKETDMELNKGPLIDCPGHALAHRPRVLGPLTIKGLE